MEKLTTFSSRNQADHIIPQELLKKFADIVYLYYKYKQKPHLSQTDYTFFNFLKKFTQNNFWSDNEGTLKGALVNWKHNIVGGYKAFQNVGNEFDPYVEVSKDNIVEETELSILLRKLYCSMIEFYNILPSKANLEKFLGKNAYSIEDEKFFKKLDGILDKLNEIFLNIIKLPQPNETPQEELWYPATDKEGKVIIKWEGKKEFIPQVKKRCAQWLDDIRGLMSLDFSDIDKSIISTDINPCINLLNYWKKKKELEIWEFYNKGENIKVRQRTLSIDYRIKIYLEAWKHIYDRHYLPTFNKETKIRPINTFWKESPHKLILERKEDIIDELHEYLTLKNNFNTLTSNVEDGHSYIELNSQGQNFTCRKYFFQAEISGKIIGKDNIEVEIQLKSIAPTHHKIAYGIKPEILKKFFL